MTEAARTRKPLYLSLPALAEAQRAIGGCEQCDPRADTPFYWILDSTVGSAGCSYRLPAPATCPACGASVTEQTRVRWS
jgi:hypothetical protein